MRFARVFASLAAEVDAPALQRSARAAVPKLVASGRGWRVGHAHLEAAFVFLVATMARLPLLDHVPHKDELNHVLAARSLLETGTLEIVPGAVPYDRGWVFTQLVAGMFRLFGESLVIARLPSLAFSAVLITLLFLWVRSEAGRVGAWLAALLLIFSPVSLMLSQWARFYTLHALLFFLICLLTYRLVNSGGYRGKRLIPIGILFAGMVALAFHLQMTTLVGLVGLGLWSALMLGPMLFRRLGTARRRIGFLAAVLGVLIVGVVAASSTGVLGWLVLRASYTDLWAEAQRDNFRYYHYILLEQYPTLWTLAPLAFLIAAATRFRAALLCGCIFGVAFLLQSLLAWKVERYLYYALPFFFALWGIAVAGALPWLQENVRQLIARATSGRLSGRAREGAVTVLLSGVVMFAAFGSASTSYAMKYLTVPDAEWQGWGGYRGHPDWVAAASLLGPEVRQAEVVLGSYDVTAVYALGRLDYLLRRVTSFHGELADFSRRGKTPVRVLSTPEALAQVMACRGSGLAIIERGHWRRGWATTDELADYLESHAEALPLPEHLRLLVFRWFEPIAAADPVDCANLR